MEALDAERLAIASALGLSVRTIFEHFHLSFHVPLRDNISEMCQDIYNQGRDVLGPATASSRYITEDAPFGLALTVVLGRLVGRPAVLHQSGLEILSAMYERDFYKENDLLKALDLESVDLDLLKEASLTGRLESHQRSLV
jgi:opine dehydrogenase